MVNKHRNRPFEIQSKASTTGERGKDKDHKKESKAQKKERGSMQSSDFVDQSDTKKRQVSKHMKLLVQFPDSYDVKFRFRFNAGHV